MLHGALQEFSLPEVFQLLTLTTKSGALTVDAAGQQGEVRFRDGAVTFATSDVRRMPLTARLLAEGLLAEEQLQEALAAHRTGGPEAVLRTLRDGGVDSSTLEEALHEQLRDAVSTLMRREQGTFAFTPGGAAEDDTVSFDAGELIEEGRRRIDEWAAMCDSLPSMDAVLALRPALPADTGAVEVTGAEWQLLAFVDGARRVRDIVELTAKGEHASCQILDGLVRKGLLEAVDVDAGQTGALGEVLARRAALQRLELIELGGEAVDEAREASGQDPTAEAVAEVGSVGDAADEAHQAVEAPQVEVSDHDEAPADAPTEDAPDDAPEDRDGDGRRAGVSVPAPAGALGEGAAVLAVSGAPAPAAPGDHRYAEAVGAAKQEAVPAGSAPAAPEAYRPRPLTRDEDVNKGLLLRLIDGVKGA